MKKTISLFIVITLIFTFTSCEKYKSGAENSVAMPETSEVTTNRPESITKKPESTTNKSTSNNKTVIFPAETGDSIKASIDTSSGYDLSPGPKFVMLKNNKTIGYGVFIKKQTYLSSLEAFKKDKNITILETSKKYGNDYILWTDNDSEYYNYSILINNSNTGIILRNVTSKESAKGFFNNCAFLLNK